MGERGLSVALCTYNGADYLRRQLDSIARQTQLPDELVICDDRSSDSTASIVKSFAAEAPFPVRFYVNESTLGVTRNFENAIRRCEGDWIALCDQDDVWLPGKLKITTAALLEAERKFGMATPILVHTDLKIVDAQCRPIAESFFVHQGMRKLHRHPLAELLLENYVTGCTLLMNRALLEAGLPVSPRALMHDWWLALVAATFGQVITLPVATVLYRQHATNSIGAKRRDLRRYMGWKEFRDRVVARFDQSAALQEHVRGRAKPHLANFLDLYHKRLRVGGIASVLWMMSMKIRTQGVLRTSVIYLLLAFKVLSASKSQQVRAIGSGL